ncbi:MAG: FAD:protein FMN transferase [Oscillospiraceae bacterium]|nr:FAD:protein FMN transferase [Oscillospiraceae bacterium]
MRRLTAILIVLILLAGCGRVRVEETLTRTDFMLDTFVTIILYGSTDELALAGAFDLVRGFDHMMSRHTSHSELYQLNHAGGAPVEVSDDLARLLAAALEYSAASGGAYDLTIAPMMDLWFRDRGIEEAEAGRRPPTVTELAQALALVDYRNVQIDGNTVRLDHGAMIDLGGIAKGYIADAAGQYLRERGVPGAIINLGGDILAVGERPGGNAFRIGIRKPFEDAWDILGVVEARDLAVVTSGVYERYFIYGDVRYHHIIDLRTGMPADNGLASVSVVSSSALEADALSIIAFLLGLEAGMSMIERTPGAEALFIQEDGQVIMTSGFEEIFTFS